MEELGRRVGLAKSVRRCVWREGVGEELRWLYGDLVGSEGVLLLDEMERGMDGKILCWIFVENCYVYLLIDMFIIYMYGVSSFVLVALHAILF